MGNGASLLSPGKRRARQQPPARDAEPQAEAEAPLAGANAAPDSPPPVLFAVTKAPEGPEDAEVEAEDAATGWEDDLPGCVDDVAAFLRSQQPADAYAEFSLALALELEQDFQSASLLLRPLLGHRGLGLSAHYHLALCLLLLAPPEPSVGAASRARAAEAQRCLERVAAAESAPEDDEAWPLVLRNSKELLAHVLAGRGDVARALGILQQLQDDEDDDGAAPSLARTLGRLQQARCLHARGDSRATAALLQRLDWPAVRKALPLAAADAVGVSSAAALAK